MTRNAWHPWWLPRGWQAQLGPTAGNGQTLMRGLVQDMANLVNTHAVDATPGEAARKALRKTISGVPLGGPWATAATGVGQQPHQVCHRLG